MYFPLVGDYGAALDPIMLNRLVLKEKLHWDVRLRVDSYLSDHWKKEGLFFIPKGQNVIDIAFWC